MADVKWIKIVVDIFDNRKIRQIEAMPEGDSILVIWFKLICLAGSTNDNGMIYFTPDIPYTEEMLATQFNRPLQTVRLAMNTFQAFGMIEIVDNFLCLPSWAKYQSTDKLEQMRSKNAERQARFRAKKRAELAESNAPVTLPVTPDNALDIEEDKELDIEEDKEDIRESTADEPPAPPQSSDLSDFDRIYAPADDGKNMTIVSFTQVKNLYNKLCPSFPRCKFLSDSRKKAIKARFSSGRTMKDFETLFIKAEASSFLKGRNDRNWIASFDWLIKDANMAKVLDGNYDDHKGGGPGAADSGNHTGQYGTWL